MAKRKAARRATSRKPAKTRAAVRRPAKRAKAKARAARPARPSKKRTGAAKPAPRRRKSRAAPARSKRATPEIVTKVPKLDRVRRTLDDTIPTPPSSLDMDRHGSAVRTGRAEMAQNQRQHGTMTQVTGGDVDVNVDTAYFSGDEAPGGDNPTPDMDIVDDIGRALGVEYNDNEELKSGDKLTARDKHRWELDPASSEDYKDRDRD
jgi:hypothetical protein